MGACIIHIWHELSYRNKTNKPGEAQADFGTADFYANERLHHEAKYLVLSFPYSNGGFFQLNYGENMECLLEGLVDLDFYHAGKNVIMYGGTGTGKTMLSILIGMSANP